MQSRHEYVLAATDHGDTPEREALWRDVQARTAAMSPQAQLEVVSGGGHFIQGDRRVAVVDAVLRAANAVGADVRRCGEVGRQSLTDLLGLPTSPLVALRQATRPTVPVA